MLGPEGEPPGELSPGLPTELPSGELPPGLEVGVLPPGLPVPEVLAPSVGPRGVGPRGVGAGALAPGSPGCLWSACWFLGYRVHLGCQAAVPWAAVPWAAVPWGCRSLGRRCPALRSTVPAHSGEPPPLLGVVLVGLELGEDSWRTTRARRQPP